MKRIRILLGVVLGCSAAIIANGQSTGIGAVQQQQNAQNNMARQDALVSIRAGTNAPEMYQGEDSDVGPQHILKTVPRRTHFQVRANSQYLYTDNVFLFPENPPTLAFKATPGTIFVNTVSAALAPDAYRLGNGRFAPTVGLQGQWFNYGLGGPSKGNFGVKLSNNDFFAQTVFIGGRYLMSGGWTAYGQFDYNRFVKQPDYSDEFYHDFTPSVGLQKDVKLRNDVLFTLGARADYHDSWTAPFTSFFGTLPRGQEDRADAAIDATLNYLATSRLVLQPYYRFQYTHYIYDTSGSLHGRNDAMHSIGFSAAYYFTEGLSLRGFANQDLRTSSDPFAKMKAYSIGADLNYTVRF